MRNGSAARLPFKRPENDIERARRAREEAEIEQAIAARMAQYERWYAEQSAMLPQALEALVRLLDAARNGAGDDQREICRHFLLGLSDGQKHTFDLTKLRRLDINLWQDCMAVLQLYQYTLCPIHLLIKDGYRLWQQLRDQ
ncbi:hypothetical protein D3C78_1126750 [compost metagenome]